MLFTGWEVRIVKNCDRGLENAARGRRPRAAFSSLLLGSSILSHSELAGRNRSVSGQERKFPPAPGTKFPPAPGTNQMAGFREFRPLTSQEKNNIYYFYWCTCK